MRTHREFPAIFEDKINILDEELRDKAGRRKSSVRLLELEKTPVPGNYDLEHLAKIHAHLFQDVSSFAGSVREHGLTKGDSHFATHEQMSYLFNTELPQRIDAANKSVTDQGKYIDAMIDLHSTLDLAHPFREGNGRVTRAFMSQLARGHGYKLEFDGIERDEWIKACIESINTGSEKLKRPLFEKIVQPTKERLVKSAIVALSCEHAPDNKQKIISSLAEQGVTSVDFEQTYKEMKDNAIARQTTDGRGGGR